MSVLFIEKSFLTSVSNVIAFLVVEIHYYAMNVIHVIDLLLLPIIHIHHHLQCHHHHLVAVTLLDHQHVVTYNEEDVAVIKGQRQLVVQQSINAAIPIPPPLVVATTMKEVVPDPRVVVTTI